MKTTLRATYKIGNNVLEMEITDITDREEFKQAKADIRREFKYFIKDMEEKLPEDQPIPVVNNTQERSCPTLKQIETLKRHGIYYIDNIPVENVTKEIANSTIKEIFAQKNIQASYNYQ